MFTPSTCAEQQCKMVLGACTVVLLPPAQIDSRMMLVDCGLTGGTKGAAAEACQVGFYRSHMLHVGSDTRIGRGW
jgi:hypothetical protein